MTERDEQAPKDVHHLHAANVADELLRRYPPSTTGAEDRIETEAAHVIRNLLRAPVDPPDPDESVWRYLDGEPPERVSEQAHGCTCPIAWRPPHDPKCPAHGRVSEASALRDKVLTALDQTYAYHDPPHGGSGFGLGFVDGYKMAANRVRRALEDTKGSTPEETEGHE